MNEQHNIKYMTVVVLLLITLGFVFLAQNEVQGKLGLFKKITRVQASIYPWHFHPLLLLMGIE